VREQRLLLGGLPVPLLDHFHPPLSERRPWESFHTTWASTLADYLNRDVLAAGFIALEQVHAGAGVEIDVASYSESADSASGGGTATVPRTVWTPALAPLALPASFPPSCTVAIQSTEGDPTLVAAIELVSPANKDRPSHRRLFAAKCATYLSRGIGLIILDVVTSRSGNLHNELVDLLGLDATYQMPAAPPLYGVGYRPLRDGTAERIDTWPLPLALGEPLPTLPLALAADYCVPVDLETAYAEACSRRRFDEVTG
jgi:hypothetical protein